MGYNHPILGCPVGAPLHIIRKLAFDMYQTHTEDVRNPRILNAGFSTHCDDNELPTSHQAAFAEARDMCKAMATKLEFQSGVCPDFGASAEVLGPKPLRKATSEGDVSHLPCNYRC